MNDKQLTPEEKAKELYPDLLQELRKSNKDISPKQQIYIDGVAYGQLLAQERISKMEKEYHQLYSNYYDMGKQEDAFRKQTAALQARVNRLEEDNNVLRFSCDQGVEMKSRISELERGVERLNMEVFQNRLEYLNEKQHAERLMGLLEKEVKNWAKFHSKIEPTLYWQSYCKENNLTP